MYGSKHLSNVALFPLCDASSVLIDALKVCADAPNTRGDALVFAWRLSLPARMNVADAANAVLVVAMSAPRESWNRQQLLIVRELMVLAGREEPSRATPAYAPTRAKRMVAVSRDAEPAATKMKSRRKTAEQADVQPGQQQTDAKGKKATPKEAKEWWRLVGRGGQPDKSPGEQRKTRTARVSREP